MISVLYLGSALNTRTIRDLSPRSGLGGWWTEHSYEEISGIGEFLLNWLSKALGEGRPRSYIAKVGLRMYSVVGGEGFSLN